MIIVPQTEQADRRADESAAAGFRKPAPPKGICKHCAKPLRLLQRLARAKFCSSEHAEMDRQKRSSRIANLLDTASRPLTPALYGKAMLPQPAEAGPDAKPRLCSGSGQWQRSLVLHLTQTETSPARRLMAALGSEYFVTPVDVQFAHRGHDIQLAVSTAPPERRLRGGILPVPVADDRSLPRREKLRRTA